MFGRVGDRGCLADGYAPEGGTGVAVGGLVGSMIGILAGPVGVLLGWSTGMLVGLAYETDEAADTDDVAERLGGTITGDVPSSRRS